MAANPRIPPSEPPLERRRDETVVEPVGKTFPWGIFAVVATIVALGLIAYYFFR